MCPVSSLAKIRPRIWFTLPLLAGGALLFLPKMLVVMGVAAGVTTVLVIALTLFFAGSVLHGHVDLFVLSWLLIFPLGYYFLTFPHERSVFTLDRALVGLLIAALIFAPSPREKFLTKTMGKAALAWSLFLAAAFVSLRKMENPLGASKNVLDPFVSPALLAYYVIRHFRLRQWLPTIHILTCLMACYVAVIAGVELMTGEDLLPLPNATFFVEETGNLMRVNGPFGTNCSLAIIGMLTLWFVVFLGRALADRLTGWRRLLHQIGIASAFAAAMMPMFRSIAITLVLVLLIEVAFNRQLHGRLIILSFLLLGVVGFLELPKIAPEFFEARVSDPSDLYGRIAQQQQTFDLFLRYPVNGVGLGNYMDTALAFPSHSYHGADSVGSPHNTLGSILAETGLTGFIPFLVAQVYFFRAFWKLRRLRNPDTLLATTFFLYVFLTYWINGVMLTSGYYSDLNYWYLFVSAVLYKFAITEPLTEASRVRPRAFARARSGVQLEGMAS